MACKKATANFFKRPSLPDRSFQVTQLFLQGQNQINGRYPLIVLGAVGNQRKRLRGFPLVPSTVPRCCEELQMADVLFSCPVAGTRPSRELERGSVRGPAGRGRQGARGPEHGAALRGRCQGNPRQLDGCWTNPPAVSQPRTLAILGCRPASLSALAGFHWSCRSCRAALARIGFQN